jgi:photosystem II stability/assembly factor-like uncharacterized protein
MKKILLFTALIFPFLSSNAQWHQITSPYAGNLWSICFSNSQNGYSGGNTAILRSADGGISWTSNNTPVFSINDISFPSVDTGYYGANNTVVGKTTNQGQSWTTIDPGVSPWGITALHFVTGTLGFIGNNGGKILKTINGGASWTVQSPGIGTSDVEEIHFFDAQTGVLVAEGGSVRRTVNGGSTWSVVLTGSSSNIYDLYFVNQTTGFFCGANGEIYKSVDAGASWTALTSGTTQYLYAICFRDVNEGYAGGANGTLLHTTNGGTSWSPVTSSTFGSINDIAFNNGRFIGVCDAGDIITDVVTGIEVPETNVTSFVFPNPCVNELHLVVDSDYREAEIRIFDLNGRDIYHSFYSSVDLLKINTRDFSRGAYIYKLILDGDKISRGSFIAVE